MPNPSKTSMNTAPTQIQKPAAPAIAVSWFQQFSKQQQQFLRDMHKIAGYTRVPTTVNPLLQKSLQAIAKSSDEQRKNFASLLRQRAQQTMIPNWGSAVKPLAILQGALKTFEAQTPVGGETPGFGTGLGKDVLEGFSTKALSGKALAGDVGKGLTTALFSGPLSAAKTLFGGTVGKIFEGLGNKLGPLLSKVPGLGKLAKHFGGMFTQMTGAQGGMGIALGLFMMIAQASGLFQAFSDILTIIFTVLGTSLIPIIQMLYDTFLSPAMISIIEQIAFFLGQIFLAFSPLIPIFGSIIQIVLSLLIPLLALLAPMFELILLPLQLLAPLLELLAPLITLLGQAALLLIAPINNLVGIITGALINAFDKIKKFFGGLIQGLFNLMNGAIEALNWVIPGKKDDLPLLSVPQFAEGGVVMGPTLAMVGEAGPEAIVPLNQMGSGSGGITVVVNGSITSRQMRELDEKLWIAQSRERMW